MSSSSTDIPPPYSGPPKPEEDTRPLPAGWIKQHDPVTKHPFFVDTFMRPPRSIWVHPFDDPEFLADLHTPDSPPPPAPASKSDTALGDIKKSDLKSRRFEDEADSNGAGPSSLRPPASGASSAHHRSFFGKLKDKAIGTKEEREAEKARKKAQKVEMERVYHERRQQLLEQQQRERQQAIAEQRAYQEVYGPPPTAGYGGPAYNGVYDPYAGGYGYGGSRGLGSGGGMALPLLGGLAGGLLLGDLLDGGFGGGGFGGGGFDGGFGGGGFF